MYGIREAFYADKQAMDKIESLYKNIYGMMRLGDFIETAPLNYDWSEIMIYVLEDKEAFLPTVSKTHVRLPKLSHLITLTAEDFFSLFKLIASGRVAPYGNSFVIPGEMEIAPAIAQFFVTNDKTWRTNPEFADKKWTERQDIEFIASLDPTRDNQLSAMQFLTARQNPDLLYFPLESSIALELDLEQIDENYCVPESAEN